MNNINRRNEAINTLESQLIKKCPNVLGLMITKDGDTLFEKYWNGSGSTTRFHVASVTKSYLSALVGIAVSQGLIQCVHTPILKYFPEYKGTPLEIKLSQISLHHLLTMTAVHAYEDWKEPLDLLCRSNNWTDFILQHIQVASSPAHFKYSSANAHLVSIILYRVSGLNAREFANRHLVNQTDQTFIPAPDMKGYGFEDLFGANVRGWVEDPEGHSTGGWGLTLTLSDMARLGDLYLNNGEKNGRQILDPEWIEDSLNKHTGSYGYMWWLLKEKDLSAFAAMGDGGNIICCVPSLKLTVVITSTFMPDVYDRWRFILEDVLPNIDILKKT